MKICIFCSSGENLEEKYYTEATQIAKILINKNQTLVTGGANVGIMKTLGIEFQKQKAKSIGILPQQFTTRNLVCYNYDEIVITKDISERKKYLIDISDVFLIFPGGIGTVDELFEVLTLKMVFKIEKPVIIYNFEGFYNNIIQFIEQIKTKMFMPNQDYFYIANDINELEKIINQIIEKNAN